MDSQPQLLDDTSEQLNTPLEIASIFRGSGDDWPYQGDRVLGADRTLLVSWHLGSIANYHYWASGQGDEFVRTQAVKLREYSRPVVLRPWAEMNADWEECQPTHSSEPPKHFGGTHREFIAAWQRVVTIMRGEGTDNVTWAFNPTTDTYAETTDVEAIYPGDEFVDYIALDGYNWGTGNGLTWRSFADVYTEQYTRLTTIAPNKPMWIAEIGSSDPHSTSPTEQTISAPKGASKGAWWQDAIETIYRDFTRIEAIILFDAEKERDWRHDSSDIALQGLNMAIASTRITYS
ncbi:MAG: glycosyl hydrolase [Candidatus Saccharimonadales bacterium]